MTTQSNLKGILNTKDMVIYGLVFMIPLAPAAMYGTYLGPSSGMVALCYLIGMVAMLFTGLSYRIMSKKYPFAGSVYLYVQKSLSPHLGFLTGWSILLDYFLMPATVVIIGSSFGNSLIPDIPLWAWSLFFILFSTITNILGVEWLSKCSWVLFVLQILVLIAFVICTIQVLVNHTIHFNTISLYNPDGFQISGVLQATGIVILSYLGFDAISTLAEEAIHPEKTVGRAIIWSILISGIIFFLTTFLAGMVYPDYQTLNPDTAFLDVVNFVGGKWLTTFTTIILITSFGMATCQTSHAAVARILFAMGRDGVLPKAMGRVSVKFQTPYVAIAFVGAIITPISLLCSLDTIATMVSFGALVGFIMLNFSIIWKFYIKDRKLRSEKSAAWKYLLLPLIGLAVTMGIFVNLDMEAHIVGFSWLAFGIGYLFLVTRGFSNPVPQMELG
ncbi:amino acid transporter [Sporomusaceae bacterium BoRhaA]|uniref:APC family permease n=1 Tax=Pelorhabdus rhamnosifermentans TaxID=2772457 RepID=UPI001C05EDD5|nr:APC family permease [Pelorhabdus rhamnosifermentans]MBU2700755.1 amino acid transporter [Pelorhabdus rhamnosifermentans]